MKLEKVDKFLQISIEKQELTDYINALNILITDITELKDTGISKEVAIAKRFSIELTKILTNARDY